MLAELRERKRNLEMASQQLAAQAQRLQQELLATRGRILEVDRLIDFLTPAEEEEASSGLEAVANDNS